MVNDEKDTEAGSPSVNRGERLNQRRATRSSELIMKPERGQMVATRGELSATFKLRRVSLRSLGRHRSSGPSVNSAENH